MKDAKILIEKQLSGLKKGTDLGMLIKIKSILIPNINDSHLIEISKNIKELGAYFHNIIPLIPLSELNHVPAPTCELLRKARNQCEKFYINFVFASNIEQIHVQFLV